MRFEADGFEKGAGSFPHGPNQSIHKIQGGTQQGRQQEGNNLIARPCARHQSEGEIGGSNQGQAHIPAYQGTHIRASQKGNRHHQGQGQQQGDTEEEETRQVFSQNHVPVPNRQGHQQFQSSTPSLITHQAHGNGGKEDGEQQGNPLKKQPQARFIPLEKPGRAPETVECQETEKELESGKDQKDGDGDVGNRGIEVAGEFPFCDGPDGMHDFSRLLE